MYAAEQKKGNLEIRSIPYSEWSACEREAKLEMPDKGVIRFHVNADHKNDGTGLGGEQKYLLGWPRFVTSFGGTPENFNDFDFFAFRLKVTSNRTGKDATWWPINLTLRSGKNSGGLTFLKRVKPGTWKDYVFPVSELRDNFHLTAADMSNITQMCFTASENRFNHGDDLKWDFMDIVLVRLKTPVILSLEVTPAIESFRRVLPWRMTVLGKRPEGLNIEQRLSNADGTVIYEEKAPLTSGEFSWAAPLDKVKFSGADCNLVLTVNVKDKQDKILTSAQKPIRVVRID